MTDYFFIGGAPKSGTTWLQQCLDLHPEIVCSGEAHLHEFLVRPIAEMLGAYNAKLSIVAKQVYEGRPCYPPLTRGEVVDITRTVATMLLARRAKPGARLIGDKTPRNAQIIEDLGVVFPGMKFILMVRDPRDVAASRLGHAARAGRREAEDRTSAYYLDLVRGSAREWRMSLERTLAYAQSHPGEVITVRYEDLVRDARRELARVFGFLGAPATSAQLKDIARRSSFEALSGGRRPGEEDRASFYRKGVVGDWPNHLSREALEILFAECGSLMLRAGYDPQPAATRGPDEAAQGPHRAA